MTTPANYSINWNATMSGAATSVSAGQLVLYTASGYVVATSANRAGGLRTSGIALTPASAATPAFGIQTGGFVEAASSTLGAGAASWVRCSTTGALERVTPSGSDDIVGWCEADGSVHLLFGTLTAAGIAGGGSPVGSNGDLQMNNAGAFAASHMNDNGVLLSATLPILTGGGYITVVAAANPSITGALRLDNTAALAGIKFREVNNLFDFNFAQADNANNVYYATDATFSNQASAASLYAVAAVGLGLGGTTYLYCSNTYLQMWANTYFKDNAAPASPGGGGVLNSVLGLPYWCDNSGFVHQLADPRTCLNANFTSAASISLQATNLSFPVITGDVWEVEFEGWTSQASGVAGAAFGLIASGGATFTQEGVVIGSSSGLTAYTAAEMTASGTGYGVLNTVAATKGTVRGRTTITVTASGTITLGVKPLAAVVSTLYAGFSLVPKRTKKV